MVRTNNISVSMTRLMGRHTIKVGYQLDKSLKKQEQLGNPKLFQGQLNFANDTNNPIDSGFGFANAALGVFTSYAQINKLFEGNFIYNSHEWYIQDNWKVNNRLSLDYGAAHHEPGAELRHEAPGVELLRRPVAGVGSAAAVRPWLLGCHEAMPERESHRRAPDDRGFAGRRNGGRHRHDRARQR